MDASVEWCRGILQEIHHKLGLSPRPFLAGVVVLLGSVFLLKKGAAYRRWNWLRKLRERKKRERDAGLEKLQAELRNAQVISDTVLSQPLADLVQQLRDGKVKSVDLLHTLQKKAVNLHQKTNCLVEPVKEAEANARQFDASGDKKGLLAGLPITIKDDIAIQGYDSTAGISSRIDHPAKEDSVLLKCLRHHGAIPFVKTNEPQCGLSMESSNPIYGATGNPHKPTHGPGGSSGGEGTMMGGGASVLGFGSDIGGSVRIPAHFCGCSAFKPTTQRISKQGMDMLMIETSTIPATWGPFGREVESLVLAMKALWDGHMSELDPLCPPIFFNDNDYSSTKKLRIGCYIDNGEFPPTPTVVRAMEMAKATLISKGHEVVDWAPLTPEKIVEYEFRILEADAGKELLSILQDDAVDPGIKGVLSALSLPDAAKWAIIKLLTPFLPKEAAILEACRGIDTFNYWVVSTVIEEYRRKVLEDWKTMGIDAIICPVLPLQSLPKGSTDELMETVSYTMFFNVLDFPAGVVRMTKVTPEDQHKLRDFPIKKRVHQKVKELLADTVGLPVGVQVAAPKWKDELCLRVMKEVESGADYCIE